MKEERKKKLRQIEENKKGPGKPSKPQKVRLHFRKFWSSDLKPLPFHFWSLFLPGPNQRTSDDERNQHIRHIICSWKNSKAQGKRCCRYYPLAYFFYCIGLIFWKVSKLKQSKNLSSNSWRTEKNWKKLRSRSRETSSESSRCSYFRPASENLSLLFMLTFKGIQ